MRKYPATGVIIFSVLCMVSITFIHKSPTPEEYNFGKYFSKQPYLKQIGMPQSLDLPKNKITVAVIDMGMDLSHPAYKDNLLESDFRGENATYPEDEAIIAHGTAVASIIAAHGKEMTGVAPNVKILPVLIGLPIPKGYEDIAKTYYKMKAEDLLKLSQNPVKLARFKKFGELRKEIVLKNMAMAIKYASDHGAKVICISASALNETKYIEDAVKYAYTKGVVIVAPTGNNARNEIVYPAKFPEVIAVGGVNEKDEWWYEEKKLEGIPIPIKQGSNFGKGIDVVAPCCKILHAVPYGGYSSEGCGTSLAAPQVAGLVALMLTMKPNLGPTEVKRLLIKGSDALGPTGWDEKYGYGRINVSNTLKLLNGG